MIRYLVFSFWSFCFVLTDCDAQTIFQYPGVYSAPGTTYRFVHPNGRWSIWYNGHITVTDSTVIVRNMHTGELVSKFNTKESEFSVRSGSEKIKSRNTGEVVVTAVGVVGSYFALIAYVKDQEKTRTESFNRCLDSTFNESCAELYPPYNRDPVISWWAGITGTTAALMWKFSEKTTTYPYYVVRGGIEGHKFLHVKVRQHQRSQAIPNKPTRKIPTQIGLISPPGRVGLGISVGF